MRENRANRTLPRPRFGREIEIEGSDLLYAVQYDPKREILDLTLHGGKRYRYRGISVWTFCRLITANSAGKAFNEIKKEINSGWVTVRKLQPY